MDDFDFDDSLFEDCDIELTGDVPSIAEIEDVISNSDRRPSRTSSLVCSASETGHDESGEDDNADDEPVNRNSSRQGRRWCFTLNNPTEEEKEYFSSLFAEHIGLVRYLVYQVEQGESGTPHIQGYIELTKQVRWKRIKTLLGDRCHLEAARGDFESNEKYCTKDEGRVDGPWHFGTPARHKQGQRNDLLAVKAMIDEGKSMKDIWDASFEICVKFHRGFDAYRLVRSVPRSVKTTVIVCYGPSGTGKSHFAHEAYPGAYWKQRGSWFDNYNDHEVVIIDEFYGWLPFDTLLRMCDKYPMMVEIKGGQVNFCPKTVVITSNCRPDEWYKNVPNMAALIRRIDKLMFFPEAYEPPKEFIDYQEFKNYVSPSHVPTFNV